MVPLKPVMKREMLQVCRVTKVRKTCWKAESDCKLEFSELNKASTGKARLLGEFSEKVFLLRHRRSIPQHVPGQLFNGLESSRVIVSVINQKEKVLKHLHICTHISLDKHPWGSITLTTLGNFRSKRKRCSSLFSFRFFPHKTSSSARGSERSTRL